MRVLIRYTCRQQRHSIELNLDVLTKTNKHIIDKLIERMKVTDFVDNKLGGPGSIV
jgi:hypothetical protein